MFFGLGVVFVSCAFWSTTQLKHNLFFVFERGSGMKEAQGCPELCRFLPLARTENALHKAAEPCSNDLALLAFLRVSGAIFAAAIAG